MNIGSVLKEPRRLWNDRVNIKNDYFSFMLFQGINGKEALLCCPHWAIDSLMFRRRCFGTVNLGTVKLKSRRCTARSRSPRQAAGTSRMVVMRDIKSQESF